MKTATRFLERRMVGDIERITAGRYRRVEVDDKTLDIRLFAPEKDDRVDVRSLSQGTLDLVYWRPGSASSASSPATAGRRSSSTIRRDARRRPRRARPRAPQGDRPRLPGDLPDDVGPATTTRPTRSSPSRAVGGRRGRAAGEGASLPRPPTPPEPRRSPTADAADAGSRSSSRTRIRDCLGRRGPAVAGRAGGPRSSASRSGSTRSACC
jgi:hypothetical protein